MTDLAEEVGVEERPVHPTASPSGPDRLFKGISAGAALTSGAVVALTVFFLIKESASALESSGIIHFFTNATWNLSTGKLGVLGVLGGTVIIATIALLVAAPLGVAMALFINEFASPRMRRPIIGAIDLLAALPSLLFGLWGLFALKNSLIRVETWLAHHVAVLPPFRLSSSETISGESSFVAGIVVAVMILPIITSISREVMAQVPREQCEAALALGGTRWGMIRTVILPFSRSGIVRSFILGLGRALGETIAVVFIIAFVYRANPHVLSAGASSIPAMIVINFGAGGNLEQSGLIAAGFALFVLTLVVNMAARAIVARSGRLQ